jgi:hypothetical protein
MLQEISVLFNFSDGGKNEKIALVLVLMLGISSPVLAGKTVISEIISGTAETNAASPEDIRIEIPEGNIFILTDIIATTGVDQTMGHFFPMVGEIRLHINLSIEGPSKSWHFQSGIPLVGELKVGIWLPGYNGFITVSGYLINAKT